jgi:hypothetical protein
MRHVLRFIEKKRQKSRSWAVWEETEGVGEGKRFGRTVLFLLNNDFGELGDLFFEVSTGERSLNLSGGLLLRHDWGQLETFAGHVALKCWLRRHRRLRLLVAAVTLCHPAPSSPTTSKNKLKK